jgi:hypothetical protein
MRRALSFIALIAVAAASAGIAIAAPTSPTVVSDAMAPGVMIYKIGSATGTGPSRTGQTGTITLTPVGEKTKVVINITGEPEGAIQPTHIHKGPCGHPGAVIWPLTDLVAGHSTTMVNAPISKVNIVGDSLNTHRSAAQLNQIMACGNIGTSMGM